MQPQNCKAMCASCASICSTWSTSIRRNSCARWHGAVRTRWRDYCRRYEEQIAEAGGIDIQLLGIGRTGHIGFNEPGSNRNSRTRLITLDHVTRCDAASDFFGEEHVPRRAITMGVGTILDARHLIMLAFGEHKAEIIAKAVEGESPRRFRPVSAGTSKRRDRARRAAAAALTRSRRPWLLGPVEWDEARIRKAVIWLRWQLKKPISATHRRGLQRRRLAGLGRRARPGLRHQSCTCFAMQETITGWPGGKPDSEKRPGDIRSRTTIIFPKRVLIFSPHPDDDVISMGGTLIRLVDQGHEVHVAYQTSGNIAVFDDDAMRFAEFRANSTGSSASSPGARRKSARNSAGTAQQEAGADR